jgi:MFS family permease
MKRPFRWYDHILINVYWLGINVMVGSTTPLLLPYLVALFVPADRKNTYFATVRVITLAMAMMAQPIAGLLSDRNTSRWGRRRPFILGATLFNLLFLLVFGAATFFYDPAEAGSFQVAAYLTLLAGIVLLQTSSNMGHGALQGLIPDLVPEDQRGRASGVKSVMELLPIFLIALVIDVRRIWPSIGVLMGAYVVTMLITLFFVQEEPLQGAPRDPIRGRVFRLVALAAIFVAVTQGASWLVRASGGLLTRWGATVGQQVVVVGLAGLIGMTLSIFVGVYVGAWVGIGRGAREHTSFIWWVINRLLFLAAVTAVQGFLQYFLVDAIGFSVEEAAQRTQLMLVVIGVFLVSGALGGGYLCDRTGRKRLVALSGLVAGGGTVVLLLSDSFAQVLVSGCFIGAAIGVFMATNWALGTDLCPPEEAGRYLGISNLAGAGAGIVGTGIGGPMADAFNALGPGLGYRVTFGIYAALFLLSVVVLTRVRGAGVES